MIGVQNNVWILTIVVAFQIILDDMNLRMLGGSWSTQEILEKKKLVKACSMVIQISMSLKTNEKQEYFVKENIK